MTSPWTASWPFFAIGEEFQNLDRATSLGFDGETSLGFDGETPLVLVLQSGGWGLL